MPFSLLFPFTGKAVLLSCVVREDLVTKAYLTWGHFSYARTLCSGFWLLGLARIYIMPL